MDQGAKHIGDAIAVGGWLVHFLNVFPAIATAISATLSAIWFAIRIYESKTVQAWIANRKQR